MVSVKSAFDFTSWPSFGVRPHDILGDERLNDIFFHCAPEANTLRIEMVVGSELKLTILLDLNVNYGSRNSSTDSSNNFLGHKWLEGNNYKVLLWPQRVSLKGGGRFLGGTGDAQ